ncbi:DsbA family protein [Candidatus Woesearchaeota archaeon]|jgi:protein-disulfide isomerase|nr:DsbA family protein [Candidatus Woesearchaeota archaeon]MBT3538338.1 DsbA family protein [Candidatus Woesearchaeota archaeon]MBT4698315.1 DsbA family protein [Candidatus Woesearchaeota archaeon]MBT4716786.1 DsbA family protein [Candidatus Woesearchaeota archaeon]MBT7106007.1 DsbA family protein [Candidatus Woesearchaeota archaeon]
MSKKKNVKKTNYLYPILAVVAIIFISWFLMNVGSVFPGLKINDSVKMSKSAGDVIFSRLDQGTSPGASLTILEFSDFECPYCSKAVGVVKQIHDAYGDQVNIVFKHFPMSYHKKAKKAAEAAECARDQGMFWEMHDVMFMNADDLAVDSLIGYASGLGLDVDTFSLCLNTGVKSILVQQDFKEGAAAGVRGTPSFIINGQLVPGAAPFEAFSQVIDQELGRMASMQYANDVQPPVLDEVVDES